MVDHTRICNSFHLCLRELLEEVIGQPGAGIGSCITGYYPRIIHHHPGSKIHLLANYYVVGKARKCAQKKGR